MDINISTGVPCYSKKYQYQGTMQKNGVEMAASCVGWGRNGNTPYLVLVASYYLALKVVAEQCVG